MVGILVADRLMGVSMPVVASGTWNRLVRLFDLGHWRDKREVGR